MIYNIHVDLKMPNIKWKKNTHGEKCVPFISKGHESSSKNFNVHSL